MERNELVIQTNRREYHMIPNDESILRDLYINTEDKKFNLMINLKTFTITTPELTNEKRSISDTTNKGNETKIETIKEEKKSISNTTDKGNGTKIETFSVKENNLQQLQEMHSQNTEKIDREKMQEIDREKTQEIKATSNQSQSDGNKKVESFNTHLWNCCIVAVSVFVILICIFSIWWLVYRRDEFEAIDDADETDNYSYYIEISADFKTNPSDLERTVLSSEASVDTITISHAEKRKESQNSLFSRTNISQQNVHNPKKSKTNVHSLFDDTDSENIV